jgi:cytochrome P450
MLPYKQANPADDLLTDMALETGEGRTYDARDFVGMATSMVIAGNDTTANLLASALYLFAKHPDQRALVIEDPSLMGNAVEEVVRYEPPVHGLARVLTRDTELYGQKLHEGEKVLLLYASGNRDDRVFPDGERFDVTRDTTGHLSFGHGVHYCVGLHLGRLESRIALGRFLERIPDYHVPVDDIHWHHIFATRQMCELPVTFDPDSVRALA